MTNRLRNISERDEHVERLARALFLKEEALLPEGETWEEANAEWGAHYRSCALAVLYEVADILDESEEMSAGVAPGPS